MNGGEGEVKLQTKILTNAKPNPPSLASQRDFGGQLKVEYIETNKGF